MFHGSRNCQLSFINYQLILFRSYGADDLNWTNKLQSYRPYGTNVLCLTTNVELVPHFLSHPETPKPPLDYQVPKKALNYNV